MTARRIHARRAITALALALTGLVVLVAGVGATVTPVASMVTARSGATATAIPDAAGNVASILVIGGTDTNGNVLSGAERYDVPTNTWSDAGNMTNLRTDARSVYIPPVTVRGLALPQGGVLVEGGHNDLNPQIAAAEIYDLATQTWVSAGALNDPRTQDSIAVVGTGTSTRVIVAGGMNGNGAVVASTESWSPATNSWTTVGAMGTIRRGFAMAPVTGNRILATGGFTTKGDDSSIARTEIYDPTSTAWSPDPVPMATARGNLTATAVSGGAQVLVTGGTGAAGPLSSAELYDVSSNTWAPAGTMAAARTGHQAVALSADLVEVVGGDPADTAESWSAADGWAGAGGPVTTEPLDRARVAPTVTLLSGTSGVLITGGYAGTPAGATNSAVRLFPTRTAPPAPTTPAPVVITPPATTPPPTTPPPALLPVQGRTLIGRPVSGVVLIRVGSGKYLPLTPGQPIPVGAYVDATNGHLTLTAAVGTTIQTAEFWGGVFIVTQPAGQGGQVDLRIVGKPVCSSKASKKVAAHKATASAAKAKKKKKKAPPRVWGDGHGNFQTRGANSAATVRGTRWLVEERCAGTYTQVARGVVSVTDFTRKKTFLLPAPRSYLAKPKTAK